jgi:hypothetical protein
MKCWGSNANGQLGDPSSVGADSSTPVTVSGISGAVAITTGAFHTCALLTDGTLRCWGLNGQGQLGDGTVTSSSTPVTVGLTGVAAVSGGGYNTCAVLADGSMQCWEATAKEARRRDHDAVIDSRARGRHHERRRCQRRMGTHLCAPSRRHGAVLGRQLGRSTWQWDGDEFVEPGPISGIAGAAGLTAAGGTPQLRAPQQRQRLVLGHERLGPVR